MSDETEELGRKIRSWREARRMGLREFARLSGISAGALSQIERGLSSPSLRSIRRISEALEVPAAWFFGEESGEGPESNLIVRKAERRLLKLGDFGVDKYLLTPYAPGQLESLLVEIAPHGTTGDEYYTHPGEETGVVLAGSFLLDIEGTHHRLEEGDVYRFDPTRPHRFSNPGDVRTCVIMTISPPFYCFQPIADTQPRRTDSVDPPLNERQKETTEEST